MRCSGPEKRNIAEGGVFGQDQFLDWNISPKVQAEHNPSDNDAVALKGVGSLFGFLKVKPVVEQLSRLVHGRLVVFFPGSFEDNNYRLLDGYDGWNYLATPITPDKDP